MKNEEFRELVDRDLSGLEWDERRRRDVLRALEGEERPVRKISTTFLIAAVVLCLSVTALAAGLIFSPKYDAVRLANDAVKAKYGLTDELIGILLRRAEVREDGTATVTYEAFDENDFPADRIGIYTVDVKGNHADASWSHDGDSTEGGLTAEAYGAEQLTMLAYHYGETLDENGNFTQANFEPGERNRNGGIPQKLTLICRDGWNCIQANVHALRIPLRYGGSGNGPAGCGIHRHCRVLPDAADRLL